MPFRFGLATVLQVRASVEQREERALQRIELQIGKTKRQIEEIDAGLRKACVTREQALRSPMPAAHLTAMLGEERSSEETKRSLLQRLQELSGERTQQMTRYQVAHRDHEALLNMRNERLALYEQEQTREQQKSLDDLFIARRKRR